MTAALELLWAPFLACLVLAGIHVYLGLHVLARGVIFVDLALAQAAALGMTAALIAGHARESPAAYAYALLFTAVGAALFALTRRRPREAPGGPAAEPAVPQEAIVGIVYAVTAALTVLALDRAPQGGEQIKQLLVGGILGVTPRDVARLAVLYAIVGGAHWLCRRPLLALSFGGEHPHARAWDFVFYLTFGVVVTSSVQAAGVLLVFSFLIVPAVIAALLVTGVGRRLAVGWATATAVSVAGLALSYAWDLPTGAAVVAAFGAALALVAGARTAVGAVASVQRAGLRALAPLGIAAGLAVMAAGALLAAFPRADHLWLDAVERVLPPVRAAFLTPYEREVHAESARSIARASAELAPLRALQADVQWGTREMAPEQRDRLRQFVAGRSEIAAGDQSVLRALRDRARNRQRFALGLPLVAGGAGLALALVRRRR